MDGAAGSGRGIAEAGQCATGAVRESEYLADSVGTLSGERLVDERNAREGADSVSGDDSRGRGPGFGIERAAEASFWRFYAVVGFVFSQRRGVYGEGACRAQSPHSRAQKGGKVMNSIQVEFLSHFALHSLILAAVAWLVACGVRQYSLRATISLLGIGLALIVSSLTMIHPVMNRDSYPMMSNEIHGEGLVVRLPLASLQIESSASGAGVVETSSVSQEIMPSLFEVALLSWALGASVFLFLLMKNVSKIQKVNKDARAPNCEEWQRIEEAHPNLRIPRKRILISRTMRGGPCLIGLRKPSLILPKRLLDLPGEKLRWALRHEEEHWRAEDSRFAVLTAFIVAAIWWNPFLWLLRRQWVESREILCDHHASMQEEAPDYSEFLLSMARGVSGSNNLATYMMSGSQLQKRIRVLLSRNRKERMSRVSRKSLLGLVVGVAMSGFAVSCVGIGERQSKEIFESYSWQSSTPIEPGSWSVTTKLVNSPEPGLRHGSVITEEQLMNVMRDYVQKEGVDISTIGRAIPKIDETASVQVYRQKDFKVGPTMKDGKFIGPDPKEGKFVGVLVDVLLSEEGQSVKLSVQVEVGFEKGRPIKQNVNAPINWRRVKRASSEGKDLLKEGEVLVLNFGEVQKGEYLSCFVILGKTS